MALNETEYVNVAVSETDARVRASLNAARGQISVGGHERDGYLFVLADDGRERIRLDGRGASGYFGGHGASGALFLRRTVIVGGRAVERVVMRFISDRGNARIGGSGADGDLLLFPEGVTDIDEDAAATIWLDSGSGNIAAGGNGKDGDLLLFPESARISTSRGEAATVWLDAHHGNIAAGGNGADGDLLLFPRTATISTSDNRHASVHLDGETGTITFEGALRSKGGPARDDRLGGYSSAEGATSHFQGTQRHGVVEFVHTHPSASGDREKLRSIRIFNPHLHDHSVVLVTPHSDTPCTHSVGRLARPLSHTPGSGSHIALHMTPTVEPDTRVRIVYWIVN